MNMRDYHTLHLEQCFYCCSAFQVTVGSLTMRTTHTQMTNWFFWRHDESNRMSECHLMIVLPFPRWSNMVLAYCLWCQKPSQSNAHVNNPRSLLNNYKFIFSASNITCFSHIFSSGWKQWLLLWLTRGSAGNHGSSKCWLVIPATSPRFLCRPTPFFRLIASRKKAVGRQRNLGLTRDPTESHWHVWKFCRAKCMHRL